MTGRALLVSHGLTTVTGFGNQHYVIARALADAGWNVYSCHKDYRGEIIEFGPNSKTEFGKNLSGITMLPWGQEPWLEDKLSYYIEKIKPDIVYTLGDIWCYKHVAPLRDKYKFVWIANYEFDTENIVSFWHEHIRVADIAVVPAKFAYEMLRDSGHKNVIYLPHSVDTSLFKPMGYDEKIKLRERINFKPTDFIISCVAHNQQRKMLSRLLRSFAILSKGRDDVKLFWHTQMKDFTGWDLPQLILDWGLENKVFLTDKTAKMVGDIHVGPEMLHEYYCISDVHALSSGGEGFGIPIVEAMACGLPNVVTDWTTTKEFLCEKKVVNGKEEFVNERGIAVPIIDIEHHFTGGTWALVDTEKMAAAFQTLKDNPNLRHQYGTKARTFAVENYDELIIKDKWKEVFEKAPEFVKELHAGDNKEFLRAVRFSGS